MAFDGSGNYSVPTGTLAITGTVINSTAYNAFLADISAAMTGSVRRNGESAWTAHQSAGGFRLTNVANGISPQDAVTKAQHDTKLAASAVSVFGLSLVDATDDAAARTTLVVPSRTGGDASGTWGISITGNAATATSATTADNGVPAGAVSAFARNTAPSGWLKANGALVSRTTYAALFAAIGTTFGVGDGSTTFGLPDLRGEFIRGWDDGRGVDSGRTFGSAQGDDFKSHTHGIGSAGVVSASGAAQTQPSALGGIQSTATGGAETRPRNVALLACIKF